MNEIQLLKNKKLMVERHLNSFEKHIFSFEKLEYRRLRHQLTVINQKILLKIKQYIK